MGLCRNPCCLLGCLIFPMISLGFGCVGWLMPLEMYNNHVLGEPDLFKEINNSPFAFTSLSFSSQSIGLCLRKGNIWRMVWDMFIKSPQSWRGTSGLSSASMSQDWDCTIIAKVSLSNRLRCWVIWVFVLLRRACTVGESHQVGFWPRWVCQLLLLL